MAHLKRHSSGHLSLHSSGHLKLKVDYQINIVGGVYWRSTFAEDLSAFMYPQQYARMGEIWGAIYPPSAYYSSDYGGERVSATNNDAGDETFEAQSRGRIYDISYDGTTPISGTVRVSGLTYTFSTGKSADLTNPTTAIFGIGTSDSLPTGCPSSWARNVLSTSSTGAGVTVPEFTAQRYVFISSILTNADDAYYATSVNWFSKNRTTAIALFTASFSAE